MSPRPSLAGMIGGCGDAAMTEVIASLLDKYFNDGR
jgi:hypothetical protein